MRPATASPARSPAAWASPHAGKRRGLADTRYPVVRGLGKGMLRRVPRAGAPKPIQRPGGSEAPAGAGLLPGLSRASIPPARAVAARSGEQNGLRVLQAVFPVGTRSRPGNIALLFIAGHGGAA